MNRTAALLFPLLLVACSKAVDQPSSAGVDRGEQQQMQRSIEETMLAVRLKAAEGRIVELERQVGAPQATPEKIDLQLLTQRVEQLEAKVYAGSPARESDAATLPAPRGRDAAPTPPPNRFNPFALLWQVEGTEWDRC